MIVDGTDWLREQVDAAEIDGAIDIRDVDPRHDSDAVDATGGHPARDLDFVVGVGLVGVNLLVSVGLIAIIWLQALGFVVDAASGGTPQLLGVPGDIAAVTIGALAGLALGAGGFAWFTRRGWTAYYWPLFGLALALGTVLVATRS